MVKHLPACHCIYLIELAWGLKERRAVMVHCKMQSAKLRGMAQSGPTASTSLAPIFLLIWGTADLWRRWEGVWGLGNQGWITDPSPSPCVHINCNGCNKEPQIGEMIPSSLRESLGYIQEERERELSHVPGESLKPALCLAQGVGATCRGEWQGDPLS